MFSLNFIKTKEAKTGLIILLFLVVVFLVIWFVKARVSNSSEQHIQGFGSKSKLGTVEAISFNSKLKKYTLTITFNNSIGTALNSNSIDTVIISVEEQLLDSVLKNYELKEQVDKSLGKKNAVDLMDNTVKIDTVQQIVEDTIVFKVQFLMSKKYLNTKADTFNRVSNITYSNDGKHYKYYSGNEASFRAAKRVYDNITPKFPEAFIVAFKNGERIPVLEAKKLIRKSAKQ